MKRPDLTRLTVDELVAMFTELGIAEYEADNADDMRLYARLFKKRRAISQELKRRGPEARKALLPLYNHPNIQVRLQAAKSSYGVAPEAARKCLQAIADSKWPPQYVAARMSLMSLDNGTSMLD